MIKFGLGGCSFTMWRVEFSPTLSPSKMTLLFNWAFSVSILPSNTAFCAKLVTPYIGHSWFHSINKQYIYVASLGKQHKRILMRWGFGQWDSLWRRFCVSGDFTGISWTASVNYVRGVLRCRRNACFVEPRMRRWPIFHQLCICQAGLGFLQCSNRWCSQWGMMRQGCPSWDRDVWINNITDRIEKFQKKTPCWGLHWVGLGNFIWYVWNKSSRHYKKKVNHVQLVLRRHCCSMTSVCYLIEVG